MDSCSFWRNVKQGCKYIATDGYNLPEKLCLAILLQKKKMNFKIAFVTFKLTLLYNYLEDNIFFTRKKFINYAFFKIINFVILSWNQLTFTKKITTHRFFK